MIEAPPVAAAYQRKVLPTFPVAIKFEMVGLFSEQKFWVAAVGADGVGLIVTVTDALPLSHPVEVICVA